MKRIAVFLVIALMITGLPMNVFAYGEVMASEPILMEDKSMDENLPSPSIDRDVALSIAKDALKDLLDFSVDDPRFKFNIQNRRDWSNPDLYVWQLNWDYSDAAESIYANVTLDAMNGDILSISSNHITYGEPLQQTTITKEEAQKIAEDFAQKVVPGLIKETILKDEGQDYRILQGGAQPIYYNFNYIRLYDDVKYENNFINIGIDGSTGKVTNFNYRWDNLEDLPSKDGIISMEDATNIIKDNLSMELIYIPIRDQYKYEPIPTHFKLAYRASSNNTNLLDAYNGKILDYNGKFREEIMKSRDITREQINEILKKAKSEVKKEQISKARAEELAQLFLKDKLDGQLKITDTTYVEGDNHWEAAGKMAWNINFSVEKETDKNDNDKKDNDINEGIAPLQNGRIMFDALTEELLAFSYWDYYGPNNEDFEPAMTWDEAYDKAIDTVAIYHPDKIDEIKTEQVFYDYQTYEAEREIAPMSYNFNFQRMVHGVLYEDNSINVSFNNRTGKLQNFSYRWQEDITFPKVENILTSDEAEDKVLQYNGVELAYNRYNTSDDYQNPIYETKLVYRLQPKKPQFSMHMLLDAKTGKGLDYAGNELPDYDMEKFDSLLEGHWVERSAQLLVQQGIIDPNTFKPDEPLTKIEAIKMLVKAKGMGYYYPMERVAMDNSKTDFSDVAEDSEEYRYIQTAIRHGIIDNKEGAFNGSKVLTREELVVLMVKTINYDALAQATDIFTLDYRDTDSIDQGLKGYVAICKGLELLRDSESFRPKDQASMAEAAHMVYESLTFLNR